MRGLARLAGDVVQLADGVLARLAPDRHAAVRGERPAVQEQGDVRGLARVCDPVVAGSGPEPRIALPVHDHDGLLQAQRTVVIRALGLRHAGALALGIAGRRSRELDYELDMDMLEIDGREGERRMRLPVENPLLVFAPGLQARLSVMEVQHPPGTVEAAAAVSIRVVERGVGEHDTVVERAVALHADTQRRHAVVAELGHGADERRLAILAEEVVRDLDDRRLHADHESSTRPVAK